MADPYRKLQKQIASLGPGTEFLESLYNDMISSGELDPNTTYEEFVAMDPLNTFDIDREQRAGGGMMDINDMTKPLKKYEHGGLHGGSSDTESLKFFPPTTKRFNPENEPDPKFLPPIQRFNPENEPDPKFLPPIQRFNPEKDKNWYQLLKDLFKEKQEGGDDSRYMRFFDKLWKEGYSQKQIDMIWNSGGKINKEDIVPERVEYDFDKEKSFVPEGEFRGAKGGLASISQMTRPVHMAGGGDPELKGLLKALTIQLMLEKGMEGSTLMPSGNPDKIKRLEDKIQAIKIELGE